MAKQYSVHITVSDGDSVNWVLKKFKRQCDSLGVVKEYRNRKAFKKPSLMNKEKREAAESRRRKDARRKRRYSKI